MKAGLDVANIQGKRGSSQAGAGGGPAVGTMAASYAVMFSVKPEAWRKNRRERAAAEADARLARGGGRPASRAQNAYDRCPSCGELTEGRWKRCSC